MGIKGKYVWRLLSWNIQVDILSRLSTKDLRNFEGVCKDWQSIIKSPRFHMLQINANPNQHGLIVALWSLEDQRECHIEPLSSNKIYKFDFSTNCGKILKSRILAVSNGLVLVEHICSNPHQISVHNPITRQCIELPQLSPELRIDWERSCDFFEHDLQFSSYKIFVVSSWNGGVYIYNSSSCKWQAVDSFSNFKLNFDSKIYDRPYSCIMYKNNIYIAFYTLEDYKLVVYNPKDDAWSNLCLSKQKTYGFPEGYGVRLIIADDRLFFVYVYNNYSMNRTTITIFEMKIEDRMFIQITQLTCTHDFLGWFLHNSIIGLGNKIIIKKDVKDVLMTFNMSTNEQQVFRNNDATRFSWGFSMYPYKYTLVSP